MCCALVLTGTVVVAVEVAVEAAVGAADGMAFEVAVAAADEVAARVAVWAAVWANRRTQGCCSSSWTEGRLEASCMYGFKDVWECVRSGFWGGCRADLKRPAHRV